MKKLMTVVCSLLLCAVLVLPTFAETETVYVTIADENGALALAMAEVPLNDEDGDGVLTIQDALIGAHAQYSDEGAAGYNSEQTEYGLSLTKLWGVENGGSYGYYLNDASAWSLTDTIVDGDRITAFVYTDLQNFSDTYSWFDVATVPVGEVTLTLNAAGFDEAFNPVTLPCADASIVIDEEETDYVTDEAGKVTLTVEEGMSVISAKSDTMTLVPPVCKVVTETLTSGDAIEAPDSESLTELPTTTSAPLTQSGDNTVLWVVITVLVAAAVAVAVVLIVKKAANNEHN